jgi:tetratricopeptide (TPR) repeat protein
MMVPEFEKAALSLNPGQIYSEPVKTQYGYHIIKLLDFKKTDLPPGTDEATYRGQLLERKKAEFINSLVADLRKKTNIEILADHLLAYKLQSEGKLPDAIIKYKKLISENPRTYVPYLFIGDLYAKMGQFTDAFETYQRALAIQELNPQSKSGIIYLAMGAAYREQSKVAQKKGDARQQSESLKLALAQFKKASTMEPDGLAIHRELKRQYEDLKMTPAAQDEERAVQRIIRQKQAEQAVSGNAPATR